MTAGRVIPKFVEGEPVLFLPDELAIPGTITAFSPALGRKTWPLSSFRAAKPLDGSRLWCFIPLLSEFRAERGSSRPQAAKDGARQYLRDCGEEVPE